MKRITLGRIAATIFIFASLCASTASFAQDDTPLFKLPDGVHTRWASFENPDAKKGEGGKANFGRKGFPCKFFAPGEKLTLAHDETHSGTIRRIWITLSERSPEIMRGIVVRMYWDGATKPAVEVPFGDFFCQPLGRTVTFENAWFDNPEGRSFNCRIPMPFKKGFKITLTNELPKTGCVIYYDVDYTIGDKHGADVGYFHANFNHQNPTTLRDDLQILPRVGGKGRFLGCNVGVIANRGEFSTTWWGEGEVKMYIDGDTSNPTLCGTGTEDYIGTAWGLGAYSKMWHGCPVADEKAGSYAFYRLHGPDPVYFYKDIKVTIQQIGAYYKPHTLDFMKKNNVESFVAPGDGKGRITQERIEKGGDFGLLERRDDWCATAYFMLNKPISPLPAIEPYAKRIAGLVGEKK